jgi:hypothetical protein
MDPRQTHEMSRKPFASSLQPPCEEEERDPRRRESKEQGQVEPGEVIGPGLRILSFHLNSKSALPPVQADALDDLRNYEIDSDMSLTANSFPVDFAARRRHPLGEESGNEHFPDEWLFGNPLQIPLGWNPPERNLAI